MVKYKFVCHAVDEDAVDLLVNLSQIDVSLTNFLAVFHVDFKLWQRDHVHGLDEEVERSNLITNRISRDDEDARHSRVSPPIDRDSDFADFRQWLKVLRPRG
jgi:hypothetical protein